MGKTMGWGEHTDELQLLSDDIVEKRLTTIDAIQQRLEQILGPGEKKFGVDFQLVAFLEYLFFKSQGPYSPYFLRYSSIIRFLIIRSPAFRNLLNNSGADAIGNMILNGRGRLKFIISDFFELGYVLDFWETCGLEKLTPRKIFQAILTKKGIFYRVQKQDPDLLIRLSNVFPMFEKEINPENVDLISLSAIAHNPFRDYYESIIEYHIHQGLALEEIIQLENSRKRDPDVKRNHFLSYLVRKHQNFQCQICSGVSPSQNFVDIQVHHIVPISANGEDLSSNMLVACKFHHKEIHSGRITLEKGEKIIINCNGGQFSTEPN